MKSIIPYPGLEATLKFLQMQVRDSMKDIKHYVPACNSPQSLYNQLKDNVRYVDDPDEIEHIKTVQSLFDEFNGCGDCDDFTVLTLAACMYNNFWPCQVILFGDSPEYPTHICSSVYNGYKYVPMDLTAPWFGYLRQYNYYQNINFYA